MKDVSRGIAWIIGSHTLIAIELIAIHRLGSEVPLLQIVFLRAVATLMLALVLARRWQVFRTEILGLQCLRSLLSVLSFWAFVLVFAHLPLLDATALSYTRALFLVAFGAALLAERVTALRWASVVVGIGGALLIIRPGFASWNTEYLLALVAPALYALAFTLTRLAARRDSALTVIAYFAVIGIALSAPSLATWCSPPLATWPWLGLMMTAGPTGTYFANLAVRRADVSILAPYEYVRLVINATFALVLFHEVPDMVSLLGTVVIIASCLLARR